MPERQAILEGLTRIANDGAAFATAWHAVLTAVVVALLAGWRPSNRRAGRWLAVPLASVSVFAWGAHNPFNGTIFAVLALVLVGLAALGSAEPVTGSGRGVQAAGMALVAFGWVYPHFLVGRPWSDYAFAAPLGLIPCPTLSVVIGLSIVGRGLGNRAWCWALAAAGVFYAVFGVARLGVWLDVPLLIGAVVLVMVGGLGARRGARSNAEAATAA